MTLWWWFSGEGGRRRRNKCIAASQRHAGATMMPMTTMTTACIYRYICRCEQWHSYTSRLDPRHLSTTTTSLWGRCHITYRLSTEVAAWIMDYGLWIMDGMDEIQIRCMKMEYDINIQYAVSGREPRRRARERREIQFISSLFHPTNKGLWRTDNFYAFY